jgi:pimeloyl-ACP methyl ester carboxylesterase
MPYSTMRDGARLHYHDIGRGKPMVLVHGFAMPAALWIPFVAPLALRHRFILPDLRGFGGSHRLPLNKPTLLTQHADDLADLLQALDLREVRLGGLSMGACTAMQYHRLYGFGRVTRYLHIDQAPCVRNGPDWRHGLMGDAQQADLAGMRALMQELEPHRGKRYRALPRPLRKRLWNELAGFYRHAFHQPVWRRFVGLARHEMLIRRLAPVANWPIYMDCLRSYLHDDYDWRSTLPQMQVPVTALVGMQSTMYPAEGQLAIAQLVPQARIVRFDNCGHAIPFEQPRRFVRELHRFLEAA